MSLNRFEEGQCVATVKVHCPCIEFHFTDPDTGNPRRRGFHASQLLDYTLDPNPNTADKDAPQSFSRP